MAEADENGRINNTPSTDNNTATTAVYEMPNVCHCSKLFFLLLFLFL